MTIFHYATLSEKEILEHFDTTLQDGLSSRQAEERLAQAGYQ